MQLHLFSALMILSSLASGQHSIYCATEVDTIIPYSGQRGGTGVYPIVFWIVRNDDGSGGVNPNIIQTELDYLNSQYNIQFESCAGYFFIDNTNLYNFTQNEEPNLPKADNMINVYYVNLSGACGYTYLPPGPDIVFIDIGCTDGRTLAHEIGHYFGLFHTHGTSNLGTTDELVDGSNCVTHGDRICDTPADPNLLGQVNTNCVYIGTQTDANGDSYNPLTDNIMSYSYHLCRDSLTPGQHLRVSNYQSLRAYLNCDSNFTYIPGLITIEVSVYAYLGGTFDPSTNAHFDKYNQLEPGVFLIPTTEPYTNLGYLVTEDAPVYSLNKFLNDGSNPAIDWILVEIRQQDSTLLLKSAVTLLYRNGEADPLSFDILQDTDFRIVVRHRNHLGLMLDSVFNSNDLYFFADFSQMGTGGDTAWTPLGYKRFLRPGNIHNDGVLKYSGQDNDRDKILIAVGGSTPSNVVGLGYYHQDANMDGYIRYTGQDNDRDMILQQLDLATSVIHETIPILNTAPTN